MKNLMCLGMANEKNDENILIIHDPSLAGFYENEFELLKKEAEDTG